MTFIEETRAWVGTDDFKLFVSFVGMLALGGVWGFFAKRKIERLQREEWAEQEERERRTGFVWRKAE